MQCVGMSDFMVDVLWAPSNDSC